MSKYRRYLPGLVVWAMMLGSASPAVAGGIPEVTLSGASSQDLGPEMVYFIDQGDQWRADELASAPSQPEWVDSGDSAPNLGLTAEPAWFAVRLTSPDDMERLADIGYSVLDDVRLYLYSGGSRIRTVETGDQRPFPTRPIYHRNFVIPLEFEAGQDYLLLVRAQTQGSLQLPFTLWEPRAFMEAEQTRLPLQMAFVGLMFALAIYNLLLFLAVRDTAYLWYVLVVVTSALTQLSINGLTYQYLWPDYPAFNELSLPLTLSLVVMGIGFFTNRFLEPENVSPTISRTCRAIGWLGVFAVGYSLLTPYESSMRLLIPTALIGSCVLLALGGYLWWRGQVLARFYVIALTSFMVGNVIYTLSKYGVLPHTTITEHSIQIGHSVEVLLLSFALAYRINLERRRRLEIEEEAREKLETRVRERTAELAEAYGEVKRLSEIDGLTGVRNRMYFEECLEQEWLRSAREQDPLSLIILDADHFKDINDTWGHPCGDAALRFMAETCSATVKRPADTVARFGGEEFVILLPNTNLEGACLLAERLRSRIAEHDLRCRDSQVPLTVSLGIACAIPQHGVSHETLVQQADRALYTAKESGRNRTAWHDSRTDHINED